MKTATAKSDLLSSFALKIIACLLMTLDHAALLFVDPVNQYPIYYALRAIGKISFPIFAYLAFRGAYQTHNARNYLLRLFFLSIALDAFSFLLGGIRHIPVADNPLVGNAFTDMFLGVLLVTLLKRKDRFSFLAVLPIAYAFFSTVAISPEYGTLFKTDWGFFSIILFLSFFIGKEICDYLLVYKAKSDGVDDRLYLDESGFFYEKVTSCVALFFTEALFYLIFRLDNTSFLLPNQFVPIGTYSLLAVVFILLSSPKKGYASKYIQYGFYAYYPFHILLLGVIAIGLGYL